MADPKTTANIEALIKEAKEKLKDQRADNLGLAYTVAGRVLFTTLGSDWYEMHVCGKNPPTDFFRNDVATRARSDVHLIRVLHLAEMLINLAQVPGCGHIIKRLQQGADVEPTFRELEVGKLLYFYRVPFRFVIPKDIKGSDYDVEFTIQRRPVCADVKHRLETTPQGEDTLLKMLSRASSRQLPADKPGAFFVSLPQSWQEDGRLTAAHVKSLESIAGKLWKKTQRVVSVVFYFSLAVDFEKFTAPIILIKEFTSTTHRFDKNLDWSIIKNSETPFVIGYPDTWFDLLKRCVW